jgi:predicted transcriptional regulator
MPTAAGAHAQTAPMPRERQRVLWALEQGWSEPRAIAIYTTLKLDRVHTELRRLEDKGIVKQVGKSCWKPARDACLLAEVWK